MNFSTIALATSTAINFQEQVRILKYIDKHPEPQAKLAKKAYKRLNLISYLLMFIVVLPIVLYSVKSMIFPKNIPNYPNGATQEIRGHISLYEDTFWYTDSSQKYEFNFDEYNIDDTYEPGENILIYLDDNNNVVSVAHETGNYGIYIKIFMMLVVPIIIIIIHIFVSRKTYAKDWFLYVQWYKKEIEPYYFQDNFEEIAATKQYYNVITNKKD